MAQKITINGNTTTSQKDVQANFPCAGMIKNILIFGTVQEKSEFEFNFGPRVPVLTQAVANSTTLLVKPGRAPQNGFSRSGSLIDPAREFGDIADYAGVVQFVDFESGPYKIEKYQPWWLSTIFQNNDIGKNVIWLQYDFIPYKNASYHDSWRLSAIAESANFQDQFNFAHSLRDVKIHIEPYIGKGAGSTEIQALLVLKHLKSGNDNHEGLTTVDEFTRDSSIIAEILITDQETNVHKAFIPYLKAGDRLAYDLVLYSGSLDESSMNIEIEANALGGDRATFRRYSSEYVIDLNGGAQI